MEKLHQGLFILQGNGEDAAGVDLGGIVIKEAVEELEDALEALVAGFGEGFGCADKVFAAGLGVGGFGADTQAAFVETCVEMECFPIFDDLAQEAGDAASTHSLEDLGVGEELKAY